MQISKITFSSDSNSNTSVQTNKRSKYPRALAYTLGGTSLGLGTFLIADCFGERRDYKEILSELDRNAEESVQSSIASNIKKLEREGVALNEIKLNILVDFLRENIKKEQETYRNELKHYRSSYLKKWTFVSSLIGLFIGTAALLIHNHYEKKTLPNIKPSNNPTPKEDLYFYNQDKIRMPDFTGAIEEYAHILTSSQIEKMSRYVSGENPGPNEILYAKRIASYSMSDWPKGLKKDKNISYFTKRYLPYERFKKPQTEKQYQTMIVEQDYTVPFKPSKNYGLFGKMFDTKKYKIYIEQITEYINASNKQERMKNLVNKFRLERYQKEKLFYDQISQKQLSLACIKSKINRDFLADFNSDNKKIPVPNSIMILSKDKQERQRNIQWLVAKANGHYVYIKDSKKSNTSRINQIYTVLEEAEENYNKDGKRTLLVVENFDKLLSKDKENEDVVGDLKDLLCKLSSEYHTTLVFEAEKTASMDSIALQSHRVKKYNLDNLIPEEELKKFQNEFVKANISQIDKSDGLKYKYIPFKKDYVELYWGDFGYSKDILWVNSEKSEKILAVLNNYDSIKAVTKFEHVKKVRFPQPDNFEILQAFNIKKTGNKTTDGKDIYEFIHE